MKEVFQCKCPYTISCDFQQKNKEKTQSVKNELEKMNKQKFEKEYVQDVYNSIAEHFSHTRYKPWPSVQRFLDSLEQTKKTLVGDLGCGNGKYIFSSPSLNFIGTDIAENFLLLIKEKNSSQQLLVTDVSRQPLRKEIFDATISIAVVHHLSTHERRMQAIMEIIRLTKQKGKILILCWAFEQEKKYES